MIKKYVLIIKMLELVAKLWNLEVQIKPKTLKVVELHNMLVTYDVEYSLFNLLKYFKEKKETELQRELAILCHNLELSFDLENEYYQYRQDVLKSDNKKLKLIEVLKGIEHGKADCIYHSYWESLLMILVSCDVIDKKLAYEISDKIGDIMVGEKDE